MHNLPIKSSIQFEHRADGSVGVAGRPDVVLKVPEGQAQVTEPEYERRLGLPTYEEQWDALAIAQGLSGRFVKFILADQSPTKQVGHYPLQPALIRLQPAKYPLTWSHRGYVIGFCFPVLLHPKEAGANRPEFVEGDCIIGVAELFDSKLADLAWEGLARKIFSHMCAVLAQRPEDPDGSGELVEIALVSRSEAACPGARVLQVWEA
jgi:hypothetical protein